MGAHQKSAEAADEQTNWGDAVREIVEGYEDPGRSFAKYWHRLYIMSLDVRWRNRRVIALC
jgi:hypothetical protein